MSRGINSSRRLKIARKILYAKLFKKYIPLTVSWAITHRCNQECLYCGIPSISKKELDTGEIFTIIDRLAYLGTERISFTGGEPLLREDLGLIIDYASSKGILSAVNTNGKLLKNTIKKLTKVSRVTLSLDGPEQIHNKLRQDDSFGEVMESIRLCISNNVPVVLTTVLSRHNLDFVDFVLDVAEKFNIKVIFQPASLYLLDTDRKNPVSPDPDKYRKVIKGLSRRKQAGEKQIYNSIAGLGHLYHWPGAAKISCWAGKLHCTIESDGAVLPCGHTEHNFKESSINCKDLSNYNIINSNPIDNCNRCWCASMVEYNLILSFNINAVRNIAKVQL